MNGPLAITRKDLVALRRLAGKAPRPERCGLCSTALPAEHPHLLHASNGEILCACEPCTFLFTYRTREAKFLRIPRDTHLLRDFTISDQDWSALRLPIDLAFFVASSAENRVIAYFPSPAGSTESLLHFDAWNDIVRNNPVLARLSPDVEALLVNRTKGGRDYFIAPIDQCYKLTGLIRSHWRGFSGGEDVWNEIERFFERLREQSRSDCEVSHA